MNCNRCQGLCVVQTELTEDGWRYDQYRCLNCGRYTDDRINDNSKLTPAQLQFMANKKGNQRMRLKNAVATNSKK